MHIPSPFPLTQTGSTALMFAIQKDNPHLVKELTLAGANVNLRNKVSWQELSKYKYTYMCRSSQWNVKYVYYVCTKLERFPIEFFL